jgi:hypothetical protein
LLASGRIGAVGGAAADGAYAVNQDLRMTREEYREWTPIRLVDPRGATTEQLVHGMRLIVEAEGPVMASRVFSIFSRAGGLGRIYEETRKRFIASLEVALKKKVFVAEREASDDPAAWIVRLPSQKPVRARSLGSRTLHEVPAAELAELMLEIRVANELISREELYRRVLAEYGLIRLTEATTNRLDYVLATWF